MTLTGRPRADNENTAYHNQSHAGSNSLTWWGDRGVLLITGPSRVSVKGFLKMHMQEERVASPQSSGHGRAGARKTVLMDKFSLWL